jgi:hypothetical protein
MTPEAIDAIIDAVGVEPDDRRTLADDLTKAHVEYQRLTDFQKGQKRRA